MWLWQLLLSERSRQAPQQGVSSTLSVRPIVADQVDYILQLRNQVRPGSPVSEHGHHIDLVQYWKEQCRRLQDECDHLRTENSKLERSNHSLTNRTSCTPDVPPTNAMNVSKRKAGAKSPSRTVKRTKVDPQNENSAAETQEIIEDDFDFLDGLGQGEPCSHRV